jgi:hypothetical protein
MHTLQLVTGQASFGGLDWLTLTAYFALLFSIAWCLLVLAWMMVPFYICTGEEFFYKAIIRSYAT